MVRLEIKKIIPRIIPHPCFSWVIARLEPKPGLAQNDRAEERRSLMTKLLTATKNLQAKVTPGVRI